MRISARTDSQAMVAGASRDESSRSTPLEPRAGRPRVTYVSWAESCSRSDHTARELGGRSHMIYKARYGSRPTTVLFKYAAQWGETLRILRAERPDAIFVMTPPVFAALPAFWYARRYGAVVVLDAHTAAFMHPRWRLFQWLQRALCRRAATTLVSNTHLASIVEAAGGHATLVPDVPVVFDELEPFPRPAIFTVAVVCSFNYDEPLPAILEAARLSPDVRFFVTGDTRYLPKGVAADVPGNVILTGFLSTPAYAGLLAGADAVLTLTSRDHTMLRGAYEAIYQGTPVIVSDWPLLRDAFGEAGICVENTGSSIAAAVAAMQQELGAYRTRAKRLRERKLARWAVTLPSIVARIEGRSGNPVAAAIGRDS